MPRRALLDQFQLPNVGYVGCTVTLFVADGTGSATAVKATLYDGLTGSGTLSNPQTFNSEGALQQPTYIDVAVIPTISGDHVGSQTLGVVCPPGGARGDYVAGGTLYLPGDFMTDGAGGANSHDLYAAVNLFAATTWAADHVDASKLKKVLDYSDIVADAAAGITFTFATRSQINLATAGIAMPADQFAGSKFDPNGKHLIPIEAASMVPAATNGATVVSGEDSTNKHNRRGLSFSNSTQQFACLDLCWPKSADESTITFQFECDSTGTGNIEFAIEAVGVGDGDTEDVAYGTPVSVIKAIASAGKKYISAASAAITIGSLSEGDTVQFRVKRVVTTSGNVAAAVILRKLRFFITTNTGTDA